MKVIKALLRRIHKSKSLGFHNFNENQFYEYLFVKNSKWNSPYPNNDELNRWVEISSHINFIRGFKYTEGNDFVFKILDLGCGRGWLVNLLRKYGICEGLDPVENVIKYAKKLFPDLIFYSGSLDENFLKLKENKYNLIVSSEVIEHIEFEERFKFCQQIFDLLSNDGFVVITTPRKEIQKFWIDKFGNPSQPLENWMTEEDVLNLFVNIGFTFLNKSYVMLPETGFHFPLYQTWLFQKK